MGFYFVIVIILIVWQTIRMALPYIVLLGILDIGTLKAIKKQKFKVGTALNILLLIVINISIVMLYRRMFPLVGYMFGEKAMPYIISCIVPFIVGNLKRFK